MISLDFDVRNKILSLLSYRSLAATEATCHAMRAASLGADHHDLWLRRCVQDFGDKPTMRIVDAMQPPTMKIGYKCLHQGMLEIRGLLAAAKTCGDDAFIENLKEASTIAAKYNIDIAEQIEKTKAARPAARQAALMALGQRRQESVLAYLSSRGDPPTASMPQSPAARPNQRMPIDISKGP